jgi:membrane protease YdiL (CAAX protease family)
MLQSPSLIEKFFSFLFKPTYQAKVPKNSFWRKLWDSFRLFNFVLIFVVLGTIVTSLVLSGLDVELENEVSNLANELNIWLFTFLVVVYAPLTEEVAFRLWLRATPWNLALGFGLALNFILSLVETAGWFSLTPWIERLYQVLGQLDSSGFVQDFELGAILFSLAVNLLILLLSIFGLYLLFKLVPRATQGVEKFFRRFFAPVFYFSAVSFGLIHIGNYLGFEEIWLLSPLLVIPQLLSGVELGYVRVQWGIWWAIFIHALNNAIPALLLIAFQFFSEPVRAIYLGGQGEVDQLVDLYTDNDYLVLGVIFLAFLGGFLVNLGVNIFSLVELIISLRKKRAMKKEAKA